MTKGNYDSIKIIIDNFVLNATYPLGIRWECKRCSACCRDTEFRRRILLLLETDVERLLKYSQDFFDSVSCIEPFIGKMKIMDSKCVFLEEGVCTVYEDRALLCRTYPFFIEVVQGVYEIKFDSQCPGIGSGRVIGKKFFEELLKICVQNRGLE